MDYCTADSVLLLLFVATMNVSFQVSFHNAFVVTVGTMIALDFVMNLLDVTFHVVLPSAFIATVGTMMISKSFMNLLDVFFQGDFLSAFKVHNNCP